MNTKHTLFFVTAVLFLIGTAAVMAQEMPSATEAVNLDENIQPKDLGVGEPRILPGSPFYFIKGITRGLQSLLTFGAVAEAELKLKFANEKLIEAKKLSETKAEPEVLTDALKNYQIEMAKLKVAADRIKGTTDDVKVDKFLDKFVDNTLKQQKLFGKFEKDLPAEVYEIVEKTKDENIAKFSDVSLKLASPDVLQEKIIKNIEVQPGSDFKQFKNLEVLQQVAEKVPETAKPAIQQAMENSFNRLKEDFEALSSKDREKFKDYVDNIGGNETRHLAIVDEFEREELPKIVREEIEKAKVKILERVETRLKEYQEKNLEAAKKEFLSHLSEQGGMESLRIVKELENNLLPEATAPVLAVKSEVTQKIVQKIEDAETPEQQKEFFEKNENKYYDAQQLEVFQEIEGLIPPEKRELYEKLKEKAIARMKAEIERARKMNSAEKGIIIDKLAGDTPEQFKILDETIPKPVTPEIIKGTAENIIKKTEFIEGPAKLGILKQKMEETEIRKVIEPLKPGVISELEAKGETLTKALGRDTVAKQIGWAKNTIESCGRTLDPLQPELRDSIRNNPPYKTLMETAFKHLANAEEALAQENFGEAFGQATAASQQASNACKAVSDVVTKEMTEGNYFNKWKEFFKRLAEIAPETFPYGYDEKLVPSITILVNCVVPEVSNAKICKEAGGEVLLKTDPSRCPYLECSKKVSAPVQEECAIGNVQYHKCANGEQVEWCTCKDWKWSCIDLPEKTCPEVQIRYYTCPDGTKVESGKCYLKDGAVQVCSILMNPDSKCPLQTPPVTPMAECATVGEIRYYQCSDGTQIPWCICGPEGSFAGAKNKWQCRYYPVGFTCPKATVLPVPAPSAITACCFQDGMCNLENKEECIAKGAKVYGSSCSPNPCPQPVPTTTTPAPAAVECKLGEIKQYKCSDGTLVEQCKCTNEGKWDCLSSPEQLCPVPTTTVPPVSAATPVSSATTEKVLTIISPNGGEMWYMGKTYDILWKSSGVEKINIEVNVSKDGAPVGTLSIAGSDITTLASAGKYSWTPNSQHLKEGNQFKIVIRNAATPYIPEDESDAYFSIADVTPPVISVLTAAGISSSAAKIEWDTDEFATSLVVYGTTDIYHTSDELQISDSSLVVHHSVPIANLQADTLYHYRVESKDAAGNLTVSDSKSFTTAAAPTGFIENQLASISRVISPLIEWLRELIK